MSRPAGAGVVALLVAGLVLSSCARGTVAVLPAPPTTLAPVPTTSTLDSGGGYLQPVEGVTTTTTTPLGPGTSSLSGTVTGPNGPVAGAVVEVERVTSPSARPATDQLATAANGGWILTDVLGGVYQIRAWRAPNLALTQPVTFFLSAGESRQVPIQLQPYHGQAISASLAPDPPVIDQPAELVVQVTDTSVDSAGIVQAQPVTGAVVTLGGSANWQISTANPVVTDTNGQGAWELTCLVSGTQPLSVVVNGAPAQALSPLSPCHSPTPTTTGPTTPTVPSSSTTVTTTATSP